uniref:Splicing factor 3a subunit 3-like n=1 Tax=Tetraselmis sp. GSL018 TaxID=582737 RepID=A0A061SIR8_9CHLO
MGREAALLRGSKTKERNWEGGKGNGERRSRIPSPKQGPQSPSVHLPIATALSIPRIPAILPSGMHLSRPFQLPGNSPMGHLNRREKLVAVLGVGSTTSAFFSAGDRGHGSKGAMASGWQSQSGNRSSGRRLATRLDSRRDSLCSSHPLICVSFPLPARWVRPSDPTRPSPLVLRRDYLGALLAYLGDFYNRTQPLGGKDRELKKFDQEFDEKFDKGEIAGWEDRGEGKISGGDASSQIDLEAFESAEELATLGPDRLKDALQSLGLKAGGTLEQRAERLMMTKGKPLESLDRKLFAKGSAPAAALPEQEREKQRAAARQSARLEGRVLLVVQMLGSVIDDTVANVEKKQARTYDELQVELERRSSWLDSPLSSEPHGAIAWEGGFGQVSPPSFWPMAPPPVPEVWARRGRD